MKKPIFLLLTIFSLFAGQAFSQVISPAGNSSVPGISKERLVKLDAMLDDAIQKEQVPGLVAMVVKDGKIVYHSAKGFADVEGGAKMQANSIFRIAS